MPKMKKLTIIRETQSNRIVDTLVHRFKELAEKEKLSIQVTVVPFDEKANQELTGDILLLSLPLMNELHYLNRLKSRFYFVSFIDPYAYALIDEKRLLKQLQLIEQFETEEIGKFHPRNSWTYTDYYLATTQMKKEQAAS